MFHWRGQLTARIGQQGATTLAGQLCVCECVCGRACFIGEGSSLHVMGSGELLAQHGSTTLVGQVCPCGCVCGCTCVGVSGDCMCMCVRVCVCV